MIKQLNKSIFLVFIFFLLCASGLTAFSQEQSPTATVASATEAAAKPTPKPFNPQEAIALVEEQQKGIEDTIKEIKTSQIPISATPVVQAVEQQLTWLQNIDLILSQQKSAYEKWISLHNQLQQLKPKTEEPEEEQVPAEPAEEEETISFLELNRLREQRQTELNRGKTFENRIRLAKTSLEQAQETYKQRQTELESITAKLDTIKEATATVELRAQFKAQHYAIRAASETIILRQIEIKNQNLEQEIYKIQLEALQNRIEQVENNVEFTQEHLEEQYERLDKEEFALKRELKQANDNKLKIEKTLSGALERMANVSSPPRALIAEVNARQLEQDANEAIIGSINEQLKWISIRKTIWKQRYDVFNNLVDDVEQNKWKVEAQEHLDTLDNEEQDLTLNIDDRKSRLTTVQTNLNNLTEEAADAKRWLELQEKNLQNIIDTWRGRQNQIEVIRRLLNKLIAEINEKISQQSWKEYIQSILKTEIYGNTVHKWLYGLISIVIIFFLAMFIRYLLIRRIRKLIDNKRFIFTPAVLDLFIKIRFWFLFILAIYIVSLFFNITEENRIRIETIFTVVLILQSAIMISFFFRTWILKYLMRSTKKDETSMSALSIFNFITQLVVWSFALILVLSNLGVDVTGLITGLGIGGVAVALALQNILGDLFASMSIVLDKPFVQGDFLIFDGYLGSVEKIGIKTTRLRSLGGEQIICPNGNLLNTRIRNYKRMHERRILFNIGVVYQTPGDKVKKIPEILKEIIEAQDNTRFDRAHFKEFGSFSLNYEAVYYVLSPDYTIYMDIQQAINFALRDRFEEEGIEFAYPTQTVFMESDAGVQVNPPQPEPPSNLQ